jgi:hypothetical protein
MRYLSLLIVLGLVASAHANTPPPEPRPEEVKPVHQVVKVPVHVQHGGLPKDAAVKAKIVIPRGLLPGAAPAAEDQGAAPRPIGGTVIAGIALSLAAVSLLWLRRGKSMNQKVLIVLVSGALALGGVGALFADIAPPGGGKRSRPPAERPVPVPAKAMILVEIVEDGEAITLTLPPK